MDKLRAIECFCRVAEARNIAAAAKAMDLVPSALSKMMTALEARLKFRLLNRSTRRVSLTPEGEAYYVHCRRLLQELEDAETGARGGRLTAQGTLRLGMHPALRVLVLGSLGALLDDHPGLKVETVITNTAAAVIDDGLDVVLRVGPLADSGLFARRLGHVHALACASPAYLRKAGEPGHPRDLAQHVGIVYGRRDEASNVDWTFTRGDESVTVSVPARVVVRDGIGVTDAALSGCGVALPMATSISHLLATGELRVVLPDWTGGRHPLFAVTASRSEVAPARVNACIEHLAAVLAPALRS